MPQALPDFRTNIYMGHKERIEIMNTIGVKRKSQECHFWKTVNYFLKCIN